MLRQAHDCDPVSFLQIWDSYQKHIKQLSKQRVTISDVPIDLRLEGRPIIITSAQSQNAPIKSLEVRDSSRGGSSNDLKSSILSQARLSIAKHL